MGILLKNGNLFSNNKVVQNDIFVDDKGVYVFIDSINYSKFNITRVIDIDNSFILPSFCDVHVHFRQPGFEYKEDIKTGSMAAAAGGYTSVCTMPNLKPAPVDFASLNVQLQAIKKSSIVDVIPFGTITSNQSGTGSLSNMKEMCDFVAGFSDDGVGVQDNSLMFDAMQMAKNLGKRIAAHCEDNSLLEKGLIRESEWKQIERDLNLVAKTGCAYHVCHISCKESADLIKQAKKNGLNVSCETAPHYLVLSDDDVKDDGKYKMNPPIKSLKDKEALIEGLFDGTIDIIATDHAPHSKEEKNRGYKNSLNGIVGLETAFPILYTCLVKNNIISLNSLVDAMSIKPRKLFGLNKNDNDFCIVDINNPYIINSNNFFSKGKSTPFDGFEVFGKNILTIKGGEIIYEAK